MIEMHNTYRGKWDKCLKIGRTGQGFANDLNAQYIPLIIIYNSTFSTYRWRGESKLIDH